MTAWVTGRAVRRNGLAAYAHLVRAPDDPDETAARGGGARGRRSRDAGGVNSRSIDDWAARLRAHLADGAPRTFHRISVELTGRSADAVAFTHLDRALWRLVHDQVLEHTLASPIRFRVRDAARAPGAEAAPAAPCPAPATPAASPTTTAQLALFERSLS